MIDEQTEKEISRISILKERINSFSNIKLENKLKRDEFTFEEQIIAVKILNARRQYIWEKWRYLLEPNPLQQIVEKLEKEQIISETNEIEITKPEKIKKERKNRTIPDYIKPEKVIEIRHIEDIIPKTHKKPRKDKETSTSSKIRELYYQGQTLRQIADQLKINYRQAHAVVHYNKYHKKKAA